MKNLIKFLKVDIRIQQVLIATTVASICFIYILPFLFIISGVWQFFSALITWWKLKDTPRRNYLLYVMFHLSMMAILIFSVFNFEHLVEAVFGDMIPGWLMLGLFIIIPAVLALWYLRYSFKTLNLLKAGNHEIFINKQIEKGLDSEEVLNRDLELIKD